MSGNEVEMAADAGTPIANNGAAPNAGRLANPRARITLITPAATKNQTTSRSSTMVASAVTAAISQRTESRSSVVAASFHEARSMMAMTVALTP
jgi:hypothetical protein